MLNLMIPSLRVYDLGNQGTSVVSKILIYPLVMTNVANWKIPTINGGF